jgi:hypothetical protein
VTAGAGEDDHARRARAGVGLEELLERLVIDGVAALGAVDRDDGDEPAVLEVDHGAAP